MIKFVESKKIDWPDFEKTLEVSLQANHWSNFGPVSRQLETCLEKMFEIDGKVVMCSSASSAIHALVELINSLTAQPLRWAVSSFGFPCTVQGPLKDAAVIDCDRNGMLDLSLVKDCDGIVATNLFGQANMEPYRKFCKDNNLHLIVDSAVGLDSCSHGPYEAISFHHTKPWGFGEGGCIIVPAELDRRVRSVINFGALPREETGRCGMNAKISDPSCALILQRVSKIKEWGPLYRKQYDRIRNIATALGVEILGNHTQGTPFCVPLLFANPTSLPICSIALHKYYKPLAKTPVASDLYERIINFPCHAEIEVVSDQEITNIITNLSESRPIL